MDALCNCDGTHMQKSHSPIRVHMSLLHRFRSLEGPVSRGNDPKSMQQRRDKLRAQLEERGEKVEE